MWGKYTHRYLTGPAAPETENGHDQGPADFSSEIGTSFTF